MKRMNFSCKNVSKQWKIIDDIFQMSTFVNNKKAK